MSFTNLQFLNPMTLTSDELYDYAEALTEQVERGRAEPIDGNGARS